MTVAELIKLLEKVEDKSLPVVCSVTEAYYEMAITRVKTVILKMDLPRQGGLKVVFLDGEMPAYEVIPGYPR